MNGIGVPPTGASMPEVCTVARILKSRTCAALDVPLPSTSAEGGHDELQVVRCHPLGPMRSVAPNFCISVSGPPFMPANFSMDAIFLPMIEVGEFGIVDRERTGGHQALHGPCRATSMLAVPPSNEEPLGSTMPIAGSMAASSGIAIPAPSRFIRSTAVRRHRA